MNERGRNSGVTGAVDVQGGPKFQATVYSWKRRRDAAIRNIRPREQNWFLPRSLGEGANLILFAKVRTDAHFEPNTLENATGTITTQLHTGRTVAYSVRFTSCYVDYSEKEKDTWDVSIGAVVTSAPTHTWLGTQTTISAPGSVTENETPDGVTVKVRDPNNLQESSTVVLDLYGLDDTDAAENTRLESYFSRTVPVTGHKIRSVALTRQGRWGAVITITHGLTNTEDDVEMGGTTYTVDESALQSSASVTVVESDATPDGGVSVSGLVLRSTTKRQLHDSKWAITYNFAETTSEDDVEFEGTITNDDPSNLIDSATVRIVNSSSTYPVALDTPPSGLKLRLITSRQLTNGDKWVHTGEYGRRSNEDDVEQGGTVYQADQSTNVISGSARVTVVESDATPDGGVTVSGLVLRYIEKKQIHDSKWEMTYVFGQNTPEDDLEFDGTVYENDPHDLTDTARVTLINSSSTYPGSLDSPPSSPTTGELVLRRIITRQLTTGGKWQHTGIYGLTTEEDDVENGGTQYQIDQSGNVVSGSAEVTVIEEDSAPDGGVSVSGLVLRYVRKQKLNENKWKMTYIFGQNTPEDDIEFDNTVYENDVSNLTDSARVTLINSSSTYPPALDTPPATPTTATLKLLRIITKKLTTSGQWQHTGIYGMRTEEDEVEFGGTSYQVDQSGNVVAGSARVTVVESDATPDGGVSVSGLVLRFIEKKQLNDGKWAITYVFGQNTPEDDIEFDGTIYDNDVSNLTDSARVTLINSSTTYPVALDTPPTTPATATLKLIRVVSKKLTTSGQWQHTGVYGLLTEEDEIEYGGTVLETEFRDGDRDTTTTVEAIATTLDALRDTTVAANINDATFRGVSLRQRTDGKAIQRIERISNDMIVADNIDVDYQRLNSYLGSVYVARFAQNNAGDWLALVSDIGLYVKTGTVVLRRRYTGATALTYSATQLAYFFRDLQATTNAANFLGYEIGSLMYRGWRTLRNYSYEAAGTAHVVEVEHTFEYRSPIGWYNDYQVAPGWFLATSAVTVGLNAPSKFGWTITPNGTGNFTLFLA